jgi:hypothetical protein
MVDGDSWPKYLPKSHNDLIAIGAIALEYGQLEGALQNLFSAATRMQPQHLSSLFHRIPNNTRRDVLAELANSTELTKELKAQIKYFLECFMVCAENRNDIMHASAGGEYHDIPASERGLILSKYSKAGNRLICSARLKDLRKVADEIHEVKGFAHGTAMNVRMFWGHHGKGTTDQFQRLMLVKRPDKPAHLEWRPWPISTDGTVKV